MQLTFIAFLLCYDVFATIDVNLSELEYLAARLDPFECRRLIAALHYTTYELPKSIAAAERKVDEEIPCLRQLLHWNSAPAEGRGKTHEAIVHRLRQLNRNDLADWLGKTAFKQLGKDLDRAMVQPFKEVAGDEADDTSYLVTTEPIENYDEEDPWLPVDTILMAILLGLLGTLLTLICTSILYRIKLRLCSSKYNKLEQEDGSIQKMHEGKNEARHTTESSGEISDYPLTDSEIETDFG